MLPADPEARNICRFPVPYYNGCAYAVIGEHFTVWRIIVVSPTGSMLFGISIELFIRLPIPAAIITALILNSSIQHIFQC